MISQDSVVYDTLLEVMDQVAHLDRKVSALLSAAGIPGPWKRAARMRRRNGRPDGRHPQAWPSPVTSTAR